MASPVLGRVDGGLRERHDRHQRESGGSARARAVLGHRFAEWVVDSVRDP